MCHLFLKGELPMSDKENTSISEVGNEDDDMGLVGLEELLKVLQEE